MAIIDGLLEFSDAQALTATAVSTNVVDLGSDIDVGPGQTLYVEFTVDVAADFTSGNETYQFDLQTDADEAFSDPTVIASTTIVAGTLVAGYRFYFIIPQANERYLRVNYTLGGTTPTITVSSWLTSEHPYTWQAYPDATN